MIKRKTVILCMLLLGISVSGCGKTREVDEASSKVIQISVAPEETSPTPAPDQVASAAVTTNGNLTMVNTYLAEQDAAGISSAESSDSGIRNPPTSIPIRFNAFFTGIGFTSQNKAFTKSKYFNCISQLFATSPSR